MDLLLMANHEDKKIFYEGNVIVVKKGQFITSILKLSEHWKWDRKKTAKFLGLLEKDQMIKKNSTTHGTTITIVNWEKYQVCGTTDGTTPTPTEGQPLPINNNDNNDNKKRVYITRFEETYKIYPRKGDKKRAYACYQARLKEGYSEDELFAATKNYADYCRRENREQKYIKLATTFFGVNTPFVDYLPKGSVEENMEDGYLVYPIDEYEIGHENPPYFGFPEKWFENGTLVKERIKPIRQPANIKYGTTKPVDYNVVQLIEMYNGRRIWYEQEHNGG